MKVVCEGCIDQCNLEEGQTGMCRARKNTDGTMIPVNYGKITSVALDSIEKKPLRRFLPGSVILSVGNFRYDLRCPFCQNHKISMAEKGGFEPVTVSPEELAQKAVELRKDGDIGVAYIYNESLVGWKYVRDTGRFTKKVGMKNVIVINGSVSDQALDEILPVVNAMNIDLKRLTESYYRKLGGNLKIAKHFITCASRRRHVELTALIVPGENDSDEEVREMAGWISPPDPEIPLHVTRFFPRWKMDGRPAANAARIYALVQTARECLGCVWIDNC